MDGTMEHFFGIFKDTPDMPDNADKKVKKSDKFSVFSFQFGGKDAVGTKVWT